MFFFFFALNGFVDFFFCFSFFSPPRLINFFWLEGTRNIVILSHLQ